MRAMHGLDPADNSFSAHTGQGAKKEKMSECVQARVGHTIGQTYSMGQFYAEYSNSSIPYG